MLDLNAMLVDKFTEVFGKDDNINDTDPTNDFIIPIVPTLGNNDIMPHNILSPGPNFWTKHFLQIWRNFVPEVQRHTFERGGWFLVEVIPNRLAVFSLNTLYFFSSNSAVDGCADKSEPGYEHMEWLRVQLQFLRQRGMKAIMSGHVPPARTENKSSWDETCWQKYALWMQQYRDVVVGSLYGHMNIDHFMLQDFEDIEKRTVKGRFESGTGVKRGSLDDELTVQSSAEYLTDLRNGWSKIPDEPASEEGWNLNLRKVNDMLRSLTRGKKHQSKHEKYLDKIGGEWAERYSVSTVTASIVPNFFPTMRIIEYNITDMTDPSFPNPAGASDAEVFETDDMDYIDIPEGACFKDESKLYKSKSKRTERHKKQPKFTVPDGPSKSSPPGPAYSAQTFSWLSYTHYYANLTRINNDFHTLLFAEDAENDNVDGQKWHRGKHKDKKPKHKPNPQPFKYEVEYDTKTDKVFGMPDLTVRSWVDLARRIGKYQSAKGEEVLDDDFEVQHPHLGNDDKPDNGGDDGVSAKKKRKGKKKKNHHRKSTNRVWFTFLRRAYVGARDDEELREEFGN